MIVEVLVEHQRHANDPAPAGMLRVCCRCGWSRVYLERGSGYQLWAEHVAQVIEGRLQK
ncbi:hypothetical protein SEA_ASHERTHEMAN_74 [Gordonia phage Ashertheman]|uniref:Uncharacterized protein n=7 Tax=Kroosvirus TaxID=2948789 RepID=A0A3G3M862_9CAUD|nr:hypothetical protein J1761_gp74 [Gordonia phage Kroos]YP_010001699.1 hypothetical protein J1762_gp72 [Gordonia phage JKSyngboy]YP_010001867.1 hypothetical protein J1764_gp74 [Gordonia phage Ashertheman]YP_010001953.1 hypothetical protein J1765_gp75 [Gordonia phage Gaea]YP_010002039.1 hypothetical protein J1766_gp75 [Gordonia phage Bizzy]YP_010002124.1 hypothetical protein J1767_gp75 [Gordonia phage Tangerine]YP_010002208.1 hypothetical protein J1768_gp74 [Gordonia phage Ribeye]UAJ15740.1 